MVTLLDLLNLCMSSLLSCSWAMLVFYNRVHLMRSMLSKALTLGSGTKAQWVIASIAQVVHTKKALNSLTLA